MGNPTCFLSYSWDSQEHKDWVRKLATELQNNGVETSLDQWDAHPGMDLTSYMEKCIRDRDFILLICTPTFCEKANSGSGGVGYEKCIVTGEIFNGIASPKKFIPILRIGDRKQSLPSYLSSRLFIDFRNDDEFNLKLEELLRHLYQSPKYVKPPLGKKPSFEVVKKEVIKSEPIKQTHKKKKPAISENEVFRSLCELGVENLKAWQLCNKWGVKSKVEFEKFQKIYDYARSPDGLTLPKEEALKFTEKYMDEFPKEDVDTLEEIFEWELDDDWEKGPPKTSHEYIELIKKYEREFEAELSLPERPTQTSRQEVGATLEQKSKPKVTGAEKEKIPAILQPRYRYPFLESRWTIPQKVISRPLDPKTITKEKEILKILSAAGVIEMSAEEIAEKLGLSILRTRGLLLDLLFRRYVFMHEQRVKLVRKVYYYSITETGKRALQPEYKWF